jgi:hypothetical protein
MKKYLLGSVFGLAALLGVVTAMPAQAAALTQQQIQAVIGLLQSFGADYSTITNVSSALGGSVIVGPTNPACPALSYNLYIGLTDAQTNGQVSALQRFLGVNPTGYFGSQTRDAVASFQQQYQVYPVTGGVGPLTRAAIARVCGGSPNPQSGFFNFNTPFSVSIGQTATESSTQQLTVSLVQISGNTAQVNLGQNCAQGTQCFYYPNQTYTMTVGQTVNFQNYSVTLSMLSSSFATFTATNGHPGNGLISITGVSGPNSLSVGQQGTWTITTSAPYGTYVSTNVSWGDEQYAYPGTSAGAAAYAQSQNTFTHSYNSAGTYTITFTATDGNGNSNTATAQVIVGSGGVVNPSGSLTASPNYGPVLLTVNFSGSIQGQQQNFSQYIISYGDGSNSGPINPIYPPCAYGTSCPVQISATHTYNTAGTYTATLSPYIACQYSNPRCMIATQNIAQATVTVTGNTWPDGSGITVTHPTASQQFLRGQDMTIAWNAAANIPSNATTQLDLYTAAGATVGTIAISSNANGSYTWHIPGFPQNYMCTMQYPNGLCGTNIPSGQYYIKVTATSNCNNTMTPSSVNGTPQITNSCQGILYGTAQSGVFTILIPVPVY